MSDWDAIFGEAALGLDLAKPDLVPAGSAQAPARRSQRPAGQAPLDPPRDRPAGPAAAGSRTVTVPVRPSMTAGPEVLSSVRITHMPATARTTRTSVIRYAQWIHREPRRITLPGVSRRRARNSSASRRKIASGLVAGAGGRFTSFRDGPAACEGRAPRPAGAATELAAACPGGGSRCGPG